MSFPSEAPSLAVRHTFVFKLVSELTDLVLKIDDQLLLEFTSVASASR
jgi:hypothetical protein